MGIAASQGKKAGDDFRMILWQVNYYIFGTGHTRGFSKSVEREGSAMYVPKQTAVQQNTDALFKAK